MKYLVGLLVAAVGAAAGTPELNLRLLNGDLADPATRGTVKVQAYPTNPADVTVPLIVKFTVTEDNVQLGRDYWLSGRISILEPSNTDPFIVVESLGLVEPSGEAKSLTVTLVVNTGYTVGSGAVTVRFSTGETPAPPVPQSLAAVETSGNVALTWSSVSGQITSYRVYRGTDGTTFQHIASPTSNSYTDSGRPAGTYHYQVRTLIGRQESGPSNTAAVTIVAPQAPTAPSGLVASEVGATSATLTWVDNSNNETEFKIERGGVQIATVAAGITSYAVTGLTGSTAYTFRVRASNAVGNSAYSNTVSLTTLPSSIQAPSGLAASPLSSTSLQVTWSDNSSIETEFQLQRSLDQVTWTTTTALAANATSTTVTGLAADTRYYFRVRAFSSTFGLTSAWSGVASGATLVGIPGVPGNVAASTSSTNQVQVSWSSVQNATLYRYRWGTTSGSLPNTGTATGLLATVGNLTPATTYYFQVRAENSSGASAYSGTVSATTATPPPPPVPSLELSGSIEGITLKMAWSNIGASRYELQLDGVTVTNVTGTSVTISKGADRMIVPLYNTPVSAFWTAVAAAPAVGKVVVNVSNGPGGSRDASYGSGIASFVANGVKVMGLVDTRTGTTVKTAATLKADVLAWKNFYGADGLTEILLDECGTALFLPGNEPDRAVYKEVADYARSLGLLVTGNVGGGAVNSINEGTVVP